MLRILVLAPGTLHAGSLPARRSRDRSDRWRELRLAVPEPSRAYGAGPEHKVDPVGTVCSLSGIGGSGPAYSWHFKQIAKAVVLHRP